MERIFRDIESYKRTAMIELVNRIAIDYQLDVQEMTERYLNEETCKPARCGARIKGGKRCSQNTYLGSNYCKRHFHLSRGTVHSQRYDERPSVFIHNHPPYMKDVPGCPRCEQEKSQPK